MTKILFIHHSAGWGGASNCLINLIMSLDKSKYKAEVLLLKKSIVAEKLAEKGIDYSIANSIFYRKYYRFFAHSEAGYVKWFQLHLFFVSSISWVLSRYIFAKKEIARHEFDIIHLNSSVLTDWLKLGTKKGKVVIHIREPFRKGKIDLLHFYFKSIIYKYADSIVAISYDNAKRIGIPTKTEIIYDFFKIPENQPSESSYASKKVLYLGGSSTSKGFYTLVAALDYLYKDVIVYFGGHYATNIKSRNILIKIIKYALTKERKRKDAIMKIKIHKNAKFLGLIYNVEDYLKEVCCLVSPFTVPHFSDPVIEAHVHRKPAIVTDVDGMKEIIDHGNNGLIIPNYDPLALAEAINELTSDSQKSKIYGKRGFQVAVSKFTPANILQLEEIYDRLMLEKTSKIKSL